MRPLPVLVMSSLLVLALRSHAETPPAKSAPRSPAAPSLPSFDPASATPYFASGPAAEARRRFAVQDWLAAAQQFDAWRKASPKSADRLQAQFLAAYALSRAGRFVAAAERFDELVASYPLLADHHRLMAARARVAAKQPGKAIAASLGIAADSPLAAEALLARAEAMRLGVDGVPLPEAVGAYRQYVESYPDSWRAAEARLRLGEVLEKREAHLGARGRAAAFRAGMQKAREQYRHVYIHFPASSWATEAKARLETMGKEALALSPAEHLARGLALFEQMRNEDSESELAAALAGKGLDASQQCVAAFHRAQSVFKQRNRPRAAPLFDEAVATCEKAPKADAAAADLHAKSLYQGARCHAAKKEVGEAIRMFARIEAKHAAHSYADDARMRIAEVITDVMGRLAVAPPGTQATWPGAPASPTPCTPCPPVKTVAEVAALIDATPDNKSIWTTLRDARDELLKTMAEKYPAGDMGGEALFRLALGFIEENRFDEAQQLLEKELRLYPREEGWWEAGRTLYWLGRVAAMQQKMPDASALWTRAAREYPLSYYALQALNRLREVAPDEEKKVVEALRGPAPAADDLAWRFPPDALYGKPAFLRGVELARLGLGSEARRELAAAGIQSAGRGTRLADPAREPQLWLAAVLFDRAGEWALSHSIPRYVLVDHARTWPAGENRKRWMISFPRGYQSLVEEHAGKNGQPVALQFAIIREESAFDPTDESFANAVGLTQLTQAPAKRFAQGLPYTREALRDPVINITIGARELGDLWARTGGQAALAIAGYNAGDGAVRRWLGAAPPGQPLDAFIEHIPYDETRGYTKRVLGTLFAYHWLYEQGDPVPPLPPAPRSF